MGRHTGTDPDLESVGTGRSGLGVPAKLALAAASVVVVIGAGVLLVPQRALARLPFGAAPPCPEQTVDVLVEPEMRPVVQEIVAPVQGADAPDGKCVSVQVRAQEGVEAVASSTILPADRAPQIWIPDSVSWTEQSSWPMQRSAPLASSPVVVGTSKAAADALGWTRTAPDWNQALRGKRPMSVPDIETEADTLEALIALWQTLGKGAPADSAVVNVVLAADRGEVPRADAALALARSGSTNAPVLPMTEQQVAATNESVGRANMIAIYPTNGSPSLEYPVMHVTAAPESPARADAVRQVLDRLASPEAQEIARRAGFRSPDGTAGSGQGINTGPVKALPAPNKDEVTAMVARIENLARPSRLLLLVDASLSMKEKLDDGLTRIQLAIAAARLGSQVLPDRAAVGIWAFADDMRGGRQYRQVAPVAVLGSTTKTGETHRAYMLRLALTFDRYLKGGDNTALYDTVLQGQKLLHEHYDPKQVNAIILMSDGRNLDPDGPTLEQTVAEIKRMNAGSEKVAVFTAGLGPDADYDALRRIAEASGGYTYRIDNAQQGQAALLDGLRRSRNLGR